MARAPRPAREHRTGARHFRAYHCRGDLRGVRRGRLFRVAEREAREASLRRRRSTAGCVPAATAPRPPGGRLQSAGELHPGNCRGYPFLRHDRCPGYLLPGLGSRRVDQPTRHAQRASRCVHWAVRHDRWPVGRRLPSCPGRCCGRSHPMGHPGRACVLLGRLARCSMSWDARTAPLDRR